MDWSPGNVLILLVVVALGAAAGWLVMSRRSPSAGSTGQSAEPGTARADEAGPGRATSTQPAESATAVTDAPAVAAVTDPPVATAATDKPVAVSEPAAPVESEPVALTEPAASEPAVPAEPPAPVESEPVALTEPAVPAEPAVPVEPVTPESEPVALAEPLAGEPALAEPDSAASEPVAPTEPPASVPAQAVSHESVPADDFRRIEGIGPKMAAALQSAGIRTYQQLAETDEATLRAAVRSAGMRATASLPTWPAKARALAGARTAD